MNIVDEKATVGGALAGIGSVADVALVFWDRGARAARLGVPPRDSAMTEGVFIGTPPR